MCSVFIEITIAVNTVSVSNLMIISNSTRHFALIEQRISSGFIFKIWVPNIFKEIKKKLF